MPIHRILIVDDSPTERYYLTDILVKHGFSVSTAESGEEAISKIRADKPDGRSGGRVTYEPDGTELDVVMP